MFSLKKAAVFVIKKYQKHISAHTPPSCRYTPTCSEYAAEAFERYGFFKGFALSLGRVCRCNPLFRGGYDPVPEKRNRRKKTEKGDR